MSNLMEGWVKAFKAAALAGSFLVIGLLVGCGHGGYYVGVGYGPPAPIVEGPYGVAPGPDYIWTPGYYNWVGGNWVWVHGAWRRRPHPVDRWVAPHWEHEGKGYRFHEGGWQHGNRFHH